MIWILLGLYTPLAGYAVWLHPTRWVVIVAILALGSAALGLTQRWPGGLLIAGLLSNASYLGALYAARHPPDIVGALLWGLWLYAWHQLGYDYTTITRLPWSAAAHHQRLKLLLTTGLLSGGLAGLLVLLLGLLPPRIPPGVGGWLRLLSLVTGIGIIALVVWSWRYLPDYTQHSEVP